MHNACNSTMLSGATLLCIFALWGGGAPAFNRRLKCVYCPLNTTKLAACSTSEKVRGKGELLYRLTANGDKIRSENSTRYAK